MSTKVPLAMMATSQVLPFGRQSGLCGQSVSTCVNAGKESEVEGKMTWRGSRNGKGKVLGLYLEAHGGGKLFCAGCARPRPIIA